MSARVRSSAKTLPQRCARKPAAVFAPVMSSLSESLRLIKSTQLSEKQRADAIFLIRLIFRKCSWLVRRLVAEIEDVEGSPLVSFSAPDINISLKSKSSSRKSASLILDLLIQQTVFNCALLQNAHKIDRRRVRPIAQEMPDFPVLGSLQSHQCAKTAQFLRDIKLGGKLWPDRRSARWKDTVFIHVAHEITSHLRDVLRWLTICRANPAVDFGFDPNELERPLKNALDFFEEDIAFEISDPDFNLKYWQELWEIISTVIVHDPSACRDCSWALWSWDDLYHREDLRRAITAKSHRTSEAEIRSHIRDKIKQAVEAVLGIIKLKKAHKRSAVR